MAEAVKLIDNKTARKGVRDRWHRTDREGQRWEALIIDAPFAFGYDDLAQLAKDAGTTDIDVEYHASTGPFSEVTPGTSSDCWIVVYLRRVD